MSSAAAEPKAPRINGQQTHALYAGVGAAVVTYAVSMDSYVAGQSAAIGAVSSYVINSVVPGTMSILPHDMAAGLLTGLGVYYLSGDLTVALGAFIGTNNAPNVAAFMKAPQAF